MLVRLWVLQHGSEERSSVFLGFFSLGRQHLSANAAASRKPSLKRSNKLGGVTGPGSILIPYLLFEPSLSELLLPAASASFHFYPPLPSSLPPSSPPHFPQLYTTAINTPSPHPLPSPPPVRLSCPTDTTHCSHPPKTTSNSQHHQSPQSASQAASSASQPALLLRLKITVVPVARLLSSSDTHQRSS